MTVNSPAFLFLLLFCWAVEMNVSKAEYGFSEGDFKKVDNFDLASSLSSIKGDLELRKKGGFELKDFYSTEDPLCQGQKDKYNNLLKAIDNYVQRYISLFLISSKLHDFKILDSKQIINADLEVFVSGEDLAFLQGYSKSKIDSSIFRDLTKLDDIFEKSIKIKENSFIKETLKSAKCFFSFNFSYFHKWTHMNYLYYGSFLLIVAVNCYFYWYPFRRVTVIVVLLVVNSLILWEGFINYLKKIKNADIENSVLLRLQYDCSTDSHRWYHSITNLIFGDKCLQYRKAINYNPTEDVFLLDSIVNAYAFYIIRTPFKIIGSSLADLTGEITSFLPWPFNILFYVPILGFFVVLFLLYLLVLRGSRLRLSCFGCGFEIEKDPCAIAGSGASTSDQTLAETPDLPVRYCSQKPEPILPGRKVKGLVSSKYRRRLGVITAAVRRRKSSRVDDEIIEGTGDSE